MVKNYCITCNEPFESKNKKAIYCRKKECRPANDNIFKTIKFNNKIKCLVCGKKLTESKNTFQFNTQCCSKECAKIRKEKISVTEICHTCLSVFKTNKSNQKFCSTNCRKRNHDFRKDKTKELILKAREELKHMMFKEQVKELKTFSSNLCKETSKI